MIDFINPYNKKILTKKKEYYIDEDGNKFNIKRKIQQIKKLCLSCNIKLKDKFLKTIEYYQ